MGARKGVRGCTGGRGRSCMHNPLRCSCRRPGRCLNPHPRFNPQTDFVTKSRPNRQQSQKLAKEVQKVHSQKATRKDYDSLATAARILLLERKDSVKYIPLSVQNPCEASHTEILYILLYIFSFLNCTSNLSRPYF